MIDVGQGDSALIELPNSKGNILIDTGGIPTYNSDVKYNLSKRLLIPLLKSKGIKNIKYVILTHGDYDHMGEAINLVNDYKIENVILNCGEYNNLERKLIELLEKNNINYYHCLKYLDIDKYKLHFLNDTDYNNENDNSSVIYTELNNYKFLFMGDAGKLVEEDIIKKYNLKKIDILKVGHHGSNTSTSKTFINNITPKYSIISVGAKNKFNHPRDSVLDILSSSKIYRTDLNGSIEIELNKIGYKIRTCPS